MNKLLILMLLLGTSTLLAQDAPLPPSEEISTPDMVSLEADETPIETAAPSVAEPEIEIPPTEATPIVEEKSSTAEISPPAAVETPAPVATSTAKVDESNDFKPYKGHWVVSFGFEGLGYELPFEFDGTKKDFEKEERSLLGGRFGVGREFYLGWGFNTTSKLEGFFMGTLFERAVTAAPEESSETFSYTKETGQIFGGEAIQSLGYLFEMRTRNPFMDEMTYLVVEPYIEAGIGRAKALNRKSFHYDTTIDEDYRHSFNDDITSTRVGVGINFTSNTGYFLYIKASQQDYSITERKEKLFSDPDPAGGAVRRNRTLKDVDMDTVTIYALGGGYKF